MTFAVPQVLWLLLLPAAFLTWEFLRALRMQDGAHPKILRAEAGLSSIRLAPAGARESALKRRRILLGAGLAFGILALARPQWGRADEPVFDRSREIVIALDLSRSMTTPDVKPTRLERSKLLIQSLLDQLHGERVGLIVFSGSAFLQSPVSSDYEILREFLPSMDPDFLPDGGTDYGQLLETALDAFGKDAAADRYLVILSDGEATDDTWRDRVPALAKRGIHVVGLGVGTATGAMIPDGSGGYMKDGTGAVVLSKLESGTLKELAGATHGAYRDASQWVDLSAVLASTVEEGRKGRFVEQNAVRHVERYQWALAQALACLVLSLWLEFPVRVQSRELRLGRRQGAGAAVGAGVCICLALAPFASRADEGPDPAAALSKIVGRISAQESRAAVDWSEMANETVTWGQHLQSASRAVPEGPVRDALAAVDAGAAQDAKAADWPRIREQLEKLLEKPKDDKKKDRQDQKQDQKENQQQNQNQDKDPQQGKNQDRQQSGKPQSSGQQPEQKRQDSAQPTPDPSAGKQGSSAFGKMQAGGRPTPAPTPPGSMQAVGGSRKDTPDPASKDPQLAASLEKLEQIRNADSPAELFGMLRKGEPPPPPSGNGKNW